MIVLLALAAAQAGVPVVHDGGAPADIVATVSGWTGLPAEEFDPVSLDSLLAGSPRTLGAAVLRHCAGETTRAADLRAEAVRAETAWREGDPDAAMDRLDLGISGLGCLGDRVEATVAARMFLLRGGLMARLGHVDAAHAELVTGLSLEPTATWDEGLPREGLALFSSVKADTATASFTTSPTNTSAGPAVDGRTVTGGGPVALRPGLHLVQIPSTAGLRSAWLTVDGDATLVVPSSYRRPVLSLMAEPARRADAEHLLLATLGTKAAYVTSDGGLWLVTVDDGDPVTTTLVEPPPPPAEEPEPRKWWQLGGKKD